jgi:hypothetical protein
MTQQQNDENRDSEVIMGMLQGKPYLRFLRFSYILDGKPHKKKAKSEEKEILQYGTKPPVHVAENKSMSLNHKAARDDWCHPAKKQRTIGRPHHQHVKFGSLIPCQHIAMG